MDEITRRRLIEMLENDQRTRDELASSGSLFVGYDPRMKAVHNANAKALAEIVDAKGWPDETKVGADGAAAAWMIAQHAIGLPRFMRACLEMIEEAAKAGRVAKWQVALLTDRIRWLEGKPQVYGTQFDWDQKGQMSPLPIEDEANVDARRRASDLVPMAEAIRENRERAAREPAPADWAARQAEFDAWAKAIGWRS